MYIKRETYLNRLIAKKDNGFIKVITAGAGLYVVAVGSTGILIAIQCLFHLKCRLFQTRIMSKV